MEVRGRLKGKEEDEDTCYGRNFDEKRVREGESYNDDNKVVEEMVEEKTRREEGEMMMEEEED